MAQPDVKNQDPSGNMNIAARMELAKLKEKAELAKQRTLQMQLELMRLDQENTTAGSPTELESDSVINRNVTYDPDSAIGKQITIFLRQVKLIARPLQLLGSANYAMWKESILSQVESVKAHFILNNKEIKSPSEGEGKIFWEQQNEWLYSYMWASVSPQARMHVDTQHDRIAYNLWQQLEARFQRPLEEERRELWIQLASLKAKDCKDDREYIQKFQDLRMRLAKIGFIMEKWQLIDLFYNGLSKQYRDFLQLKIEKQRESKGKAVTLDIDIAIDEIITRLPKEKEKEPEASGGNRGFHKNLTRDKSPTRGRSRRRSQRRSKSRSQRRSKSRSRKRRSSCNHTQNNSQEPQCGYCNSPRHPEHNCWLKHPEKAPPGWKEENLHHIEHYRVKNASSTSLAVFAGPRTAGNVYGFHTDAAL